MSTLRREDIAHLASLARIEMSDTDLDAMLAEVSAILDAVATVQQAPTEGVEPMSHPMPLTNAFRDDIGTPGLTAEQALAGAPEREDGRFLVPRILTED